MVRNSEIEEEQSLLLYPEKNYKDRNPETLEKESSLLYPEKNYKDRNSEIEEQQFLVLSREVLQGYTFRN